MPLFVRTSSNAFQCTRHMVHSFLSSHITAKKPTFNKQVASQYVINNDDIIINKKLKNNEQIADEHWIEIRKELLKTYTRGLTETTVDALVYDLCDQHCRYDQAKNYFKFLERNNYNITLLLMGRYLRTLSSSEEITEAEEQEICKTYDRIREKHSMLDSRTCANCILAISKTKRWIEAFELLDMLRISSMPGQHIIAALCEAALKNDKPELAWKLMNEFIENFPMAHKVYLDYLDYCKRNFKGKNLIKEIEKIFYFWQKNWVIPVDFVMEEYMKTFSTLGYNTAFASLWKEDQCSVCQGLFKKTTLSETDFKELSKSVLKKLIIGQNVYQNTSPEELEKYMRFIKHLKPYDIIIDGLNVAYFTVVNKRGSLDNVLQVVNNFLPKYKRILVIGRVHMKWWSAEVLKKIKQKADVFLLQNVSEDDPFLLHLALLSGPQTYFVSRDLMRQHLYKLEEENVRRLFQCWQLSRQYMIVQDTSKNKGIVVPPIRIDINVQNVNNGWHIPSTRNRNLPLPNSYSGPEIWACIMKNQPRKN